MKTLEERKREQIADVESDVDFCIVHLLPWFSPEEILEWLAERVRWNDNAYQDYLSRPSQ